MNIKTNYGQTPIPNNIWNMSLTDILKLGNLANIYGIALSKSRNESMTFQLAQLLNQYINKEGNKWLEVARRIVQNNYQIGFQLTIMYHTLLQPLISGLFSKASTQKTAEYYHRKIFNILQQQVSSQQISIITISNIQFYIEQALKFKNMLILTQIFSMIIHHSDKFSKMFDFLINLNVREINQQNFQFVWNTHYNTLMLFQNIVQIVYIMQKNAAKLMKVIQFSNQIRNIKNIIQKYLPTIVDLISTLPILTNRQSKSTFFLNAILPTSLLSLLQNQKTGVLTTYYQQLTNIIFIITDCPCFQILLSNNNILISSLINTQLSINMVYLNNYSNLNDQLMALNQQINRQLYSDTLAGGWIRMIVSLNKNIGGFFNLYLNKLYQIVQIKRVQKLRGEQLVGYLLRICLLSDYQIMQNRKQQMQKILSSTTDLFVNNWNNYSQWEQIQILHYFIAFITKVENAKTIGISTSSQQLISKCINLCLKCLSQTTDMLQQQSYSSSDLSPLHSQCHSILQLLPQSPASLRLLTSNLQQIVSQFINFPYSSIKFLQLFHSYLIKIPQIIFRSSSIIIQYFEKCWREQQQLLSRNTKGQRRAQGSLKLVRLAQIFTTIVSSGAQLLFEDVEDRIVKPILSKICEPYQIDFQQELLEILQALLSKHHYFTSQICLILSKMPILFQKNNKKLSILRDIYLSLSLSNHIRNQILYEYPDLIRVMINMLVTYTQEQLSVEQFMYYQQQVRKLFWCLQIFIQKFFPFLIQNEDMIQALVKIFEALCKIMQNTQKFIQQYNQSHLNLEYSYLSTYLQFKQLVLQMTFTLSHMLIPTRINQNLLSSTIRLIKRIQIPKLIYFETIKMIPVILIDQLHINSEKHQQVMNDIIKFCEYMTNMEIEHGINKYWKNIENVGQWDEWPKSTKDYIQNVLREMRNRKKLDQFQHLQYLEALQKFLR